MAIDEQWIPIDGTNGMYDVSNLGRVRSWKNGKWGRSEQPRILKPGAGKGPRQYLGVLIDRHDGRPRTWKIHTLVAEAFIGPRPEGLHICHQDGDPFNNAASNLRYDEPKANAYDKFSHGTQKLGVAHPMSKLTPDQVRAIRVALQSLAIRKVAAQFGVSAGTVADIKTGKTWSHLQ